jgi:hypothetical protein
MQWFFLLFLIPSIAYSFIREEPKVDHGIQVACVWVRALTQNGEETSMVICVPWNFKFIRL